MKSVSKWEKGLQSVVDNGRGHSIVIDLPDSSGGTDRGATALELAVMGFAGCVTTIFAMIAQKMRLEFSTLEVELEAEKPQGASTVTAVEYIVRIESEETRDKIEKCLDLTIESCPVGILFKQAGIKISKELILL